MSTDSTPCPESLVQEYRNRTDWLGLTCAGQLLWSGADRREGRRGVGWREGRRGGGVEKGM